MLTANTEDRTAGIDFTGDRTYLPFRYFVLSFLLFVVVFTTGCSSCSQVTSGGNGSAQDDTSYWERKTPHRRVIIFVHGVMGDPRETWTNDGTKASFPTLLTKDKTFDDADIYVER